MQPLLHTSRTPTCVHVVAFSCRRLSFNFIWTVTIVFILSLLEDIFYGMLNRKTWTEVTKMFIQAYPL